MQKRDRFNLILAAVAATAMLSAAQTPIWSEEFDAGTAPDDRVWSYDLGSSGWGNAELQNYTSNAANVRVESGALVITAQRQGNSFTSARVRTQDKLTFKYGTVEARIQTPDLGNGLWPAFWTLGNNFSSVGWPACGEIDVLEMGSGSAISGGVVNRRVASTAHWEYNGGHASYGLSNDRPSALNGTYHVYRMEWTPSQIRTFIDGVWIWTMDISGGAGADLEEFHQPHFFILNLAVGGNYTGILNAGGITAPFPAQYKVDWIRIYDNGYTVLGGTSTVVPPVPGSNLLVNAGFESGTAGWSENLSGGTAAASSAFAHSGASALMINSTGAGDWASPNLSQTFPATAGEVYYLQGWLLNPAADPVSGSSFGLFKIEFRDQAGGILQPASVDLGTSAGGPYYGAESAPLLNAGSARDTWIRSRAMATAPAGTASVGFYLLNVNQPGNAGPVFYDDVEAVRVGDPVPPFSLTPSVAGGNLQVRFPTQMGIRYTTAYKNSLTNAVWTPIETIIGDGTTNSAVYPVDAAQRFYRITIP